MGPIEHAVLVKAALGAVVLAGAGLAVAGCASTTPKLAAAAHPQDCGAGATYVAHPKPPTFPAWATPGCYPTSQTSPAVLTARGCRVLARWENSSVSVPIENPSQTAVRARIEAAAHGTRFARDFAAWVAPASLLSTLTNADKVSADCKAAGVPGVLGASPAPSPSAKPKPAPKPKPPAPAVVYVVNGSPADVTYGPAGSDITGTVPMRVSAPLASPSYYAITAQLQGGGVVTCKLKINGQVISAATASGGYNIAQCEADQNPITGAWENTNGGG
jgi:hypothetical protein